MTDLQALPMFGRDEFIAERFHYQRGEHVTFLAPTGNGKTTLAYMLLEQVSTPKLPSISLVMKRRDTTVRDWAKRLDYRVVRQWPPLPSVWSARKPSGYVLWPKKSAGMDIYRHREDQYKQFQAAMTKSLDKGDRIIFGDETLGLTDILGLTDYCVELWTQGRSMDVGFWAATQKPSHIPLYAYNQATHLFLGRDPDKRNRDRFSEISGVDPDVVKRTVLELDKFQWLYINQNGPHMCVIDKN